MNKETLRAAVLHVLADHPNLAPERYVVLALATEFGLKITYSELRGILLELDEKKLATSIRRDDSKVVWRATELGKSVLAELH